MLAMGLRYLTGRVVAAAPGGDEPEWPPHPGRVFMALVAALHEGHPTPPPAERAALEWLEGLPPPHLAASPAAPRALVTAYVPVNDTADPMHKKKCSPPFASHVPIGRKRQPRTFASATLEDDVAYLVWPEVDPSPSVLSGLESLCDRVTSIGHSASLVQAWIEADPPPPTLVPGPRHVTHRLRVATQGRLAELETRFAAGLRPGPGRFVGYGPPAPAVEPVVHAETEFDDRLIVVRRVGGPTPALESSAVLAGALRNALMRWSETQPAPEVLCGHPAGSSRPSARTHAALLALGNVGHGHADGRLLGLAVALPRASSAQERTVVARAVARWLAPRGQVDAALGLDGSGGGGGELDIRAGVMSFAYEDRDPPPRTLDAGRWTRPVLPSSRWCSATPVVLDRYPKRPEDEESIVRAACRRIGLPDPLDVIVSDVSLLAVVPPARRFPRFPARGPGRPQRHVVLTFDRPVIGPITIGAGRYLGYGLCCPLED